MPKVRTTLTIDQDVLLAWQKIARTQRTSLSAAVNEWLEDTQEAAQYKAFQVHVQGQNVRDRVSEITAALTVVQEGYANVIQGSKLGGSGSRDGKRSAARDPLPPSPPSCNTGGKLAKQARGSRG